MAHSQEDREALGKRLAAARNLNGLTIEGAAKELTKRGYPVSKAGVGAWEKGRNVPDAIWLRRLAKLYGTTLDALAWDDSLSIEAIQLAAQFDGLNEKQKSTLKALWMAYISESTDDAEVEARMPITQTTKERE
jgi:transcriptional regulator with XRE-family HTH domain